MPVYKIPEKNFHTLQQKILDLNKRAKKCNCSLITYSIIKTDEIATNSLNNSDIKSVYKIYHINIEGASPVINGWQFIATIQHSESGNFLNKSPFYSETLPEKYRTITGYCDHCKIDRFRKNTYILKSGNEYKQVGSTCLADFLGYADIHNIADYAEKMILTAIDFEGYEEDAERSGFGNDGHKSVNLKKLLINSAHVIRTFGFTSRAKSEEQGLPSTSDRINGLYYSGSKPKQETLDQLGSEIPLDMETAEKTLEYIKDIPESTDNDYLWNLHIISQNEYIPLEKIPLAVSAISAYQKSIQKKETFENSQHIGTIGEKITFIGILKTQKPITTQYGISTLYVFDNAGNRIVWFASGQPFNYEIGTELKIKGIIKNHEEYKGIKQTTLTRCKEIN